MFHRIRKKFIDNVHGGAIEGELQVLTVFRRGCLGDQVFKLTRGLAGRETVQHSRGVLAKFHQSNETQHRPGPETAQNVKGKLQWVFKKDQWSTRGPGQVYRHHG